MALSLGCGADSTVLALAEPDECGDTEARRFAALSPDERLARIVARCVRCREIVLPEGTQLRASVGDGRLWIGVVPLSYGRLVERAWNPDTGDATLLYDGPGFASATPESLQVFVPSAERGIQLGTLLAIGWDGGAPVVAADQIGWHRRQLGEQRWLSVVADVDGEVGTLVVHDAGERHELDTQVQVHTPALAAGLAAGDPLVYAVRDGQRSGLYRRPLP